MTALIVATLGIGIGANVAMAGLIDRLLLRPPPHVVEPGRVSRLLFSMPMSAAGTSVGQKWSYPAVLDLARDAPAFDQVAAYVDAPLVLADKADMQEVQASLVSPTFFPLFGVRPLIGRLFSSADGLPEGDASGGPPLAVISFGFWKRQFSGDSAVLGHNVRVGSVTYTIVGVAPRDFRGTSVIPPDVWLPISVAGEAEATASWRSGRATIWLFAVGRLRDGVTATQASQQATSVWRQFNAPPGTDAAAAQVLTASVIPGRGPDAPREVKVALWLAGVSTLVLLIACANVANLLLARAFTRRREIAVRLALGAGRGRLARQLLTESAVLALLGGAAAVLITVASDGMLRRLFVAGAANAEGVLDARLLLFTAVVALGTGVLIGLAPLFQTIRQDLIVDLRAGAGDGGGRTARVRTLLLGAQAAFCMLLLVVAGLFAQSLHRVEGIDLGVDVDRTLLVQLDIGRVALTDVEVAQIYGDIRERVHAAPGVAGAALASWNPFGGGQAVGPYTREHGDEYYWPPGRTGAVPTATAVDSGFFRAIGARSLRGRDFTSADVRGAPRVTIINQPMSDFLWPGEDALGRCIYFEAHESQAEGCTTVVGVLPGFIKRRVLDRDAMAVYLPLAQTKLNGGRPGSMAIGLNPGADAAVVIHAVRQSIMSVRPGMPAPRIVPMREMVDPEFRQWQVAATMFSIFGAIALVIAAVGLYATVSFQATQRSTEIAVRVALGARARNVLGVVAGDSLRTVVIGLAIGMAAALGIRNQIGPLLFETSPSDPGIITAVAVLLLVVAILATLIPTVRVLRRDPGAVLRID